MNIEVLWDGAYGLSSLSEKTRKSNHLQMSLQRQHFLLSYLKTLSVGPAGVWTHDLPHGSPMLSTVQYFAVAFLLCCLRWTLFDSVDEILNCDCFNESDRAALAYGAVYYAVQGEHLLSLWMKS